MERRTLLKLGAISAAVFMVAGGVTTLLRPGLHEGQLTPAARAVFSAVALAILDGTLAVDVSQSRKAIDGLLSRVDVLVRGFPPHVQSELSQLLGLLASSAGRRGLAGLATDWHLASVPEVQQALQSMRLSGMNLRQQAYHALHDIVGVAYFSDASTWPGLGYPGPLNV